MKTIELTKGKVALVDDCDSEYLNQFNWWWFKGYASSHVKGVGILMHRAIMTPTDLDHIDHIDGNGCTNTRANLRLVTNSQNSYNQGLRINNTSGYKGVSRDKRRTKWRAYIVLKGKQYGLGVFDCKHAAAAAYNKKALEFYGEFANLNVIGSPGHSLRETIPMSEPSDKKERLRVDNTSGVRGIYYCNTWHRWKVSVQIDKVRKHLGNFKTKEEAIQCLNLHKESIQRSN
jgi:hypothetical protein